ncbi:conserved Plasmodium protein, unknown function [Plasmodium knowlesi strain H]|uniref:Reticulocyte binding protein n=3 Tax=Plasmodium knowlesi TaxID=5850 RepID=A0A1A7VD70_PLAKH|nr:conserved Plasmodium protein, unknown function [Plasmodium knowlesi strain H]OTN67676.1 Uncharacterized protein PKNOH_S05397200 [Plasmodium knowlesi]CAA9990559.1 conserved Plasmodium protein, unknown function [Plasmodium knowlesi strain H]SBO19819.1 conserved Plasmodium protein, unknown function [Plasmodium knowlesi strain H]SBO22362.1 conserved Plasmodium protein, unknown function [Plasmodium knowlesi strain H]VVS80033.1 conserved Plasmodium protein, unknown function [Plasmodium knowlesi s
MRKVQIIFAICYFLILCCLIKPSTVSIFCENISDDEDVYTSTLRGQNFSEEFIALFDNKDVRATIEKFISEEHVKNYISSVRKTEENIIKTVEKLLVTEFPSTIGLKGDIVKNELLKFLTIIFTKQENLVKKIFDYFNKSSFNIGENYRHFENKFWGQYENIENLKKKYSSIFNQVYESVDSTKKSEDNKSSVYFIDIKDKIISNITSLKDILRKLRGEVVSLYNLNYGLNELKNEVDGYIIKFKREIQGEEGTPISEDAGNGKENDMNMLNLVEDVISKLMFELGTQVSKTKDELQKRITTLEKEHMDMSNEITRLDIHQNSPKLSIVKNNNFLNIESIRGEYEEYVNKMKTDGDAVDDTNGEKDIKDSDGEDDGPVFEKTMVLLEKHSSWVKEQDALTYCKRDDIAEVLKICLNLVEKVRDLIIHENFNLLMKYEKLYEELNKFLYDSRSRTLDMSYMKAWYAIENFNGTEILIKGVDRLLRTISILTQMINLFKETNKNMNADVISNLNKLNDGFNNAAEKVILFKVELAKLMHPTHSLQVIKNNIEKFGHVYKDNLAKMKVITNSFDIASENMQREIDEILKIVSNIIQTDNLISEFKTIRRVWKGHVKLTLNELNEKKGLLINAYKENRDVIFPPWMDYSTSNVLPSGGLGNALTGALGGLLSRILSHAGNLNGNSISKNTLESPYFMNMYKNVMNKLDTVKDEGEMKKLFSVIYRSVDSVIEIVRENREQINREYKKKREDIMNLVNYRKDSRVDMTKVYNKLIELEGDLVRNLEKLFLNKVNLYKQLEHSVEVTKEELFKDKVPPYCQLVEEFITKYFLTMVRWKRLINNNRDLFPPELISNIVE